MLNTIIKVKVTERLNIRPAAVVMYVSDDL